MATFQPILSQTGGSSITPQQASVDVNPVVQFASAVAPMAVEAGFQYSASQELKSLQQKFQTIANARRQGASIAETSARARSELSKSMASAPWAADRAKGMFEAVFMGGTSGGTGGVSGQLGGAGLLTPTMQESNQAKYSEEVDMLARRSNITNEEASKRIAVSNQAVALKEQAEVNKHIKEGNFDRFYSALQSQIVDARINLSNDLIKLVKDSGGSLDANQTREYKTSIKMLKDRHKRDLDSSLRLNGNLTIDEQQYESLMGDLDSMYSDLDSMADDHEYLSLMSSINAEQNAEFLLTASKEFTAIRLANQYGGSQFAADLAKDLYNRNTADQAAMVRDNPIYKALFGDGNDVKTSAQSGMKKLIIGFDPSTNDKDTAYSPRMNEKEAISVPSYLLRKDSDMYNGYVEGVNKAIDNGTYDQKSMNELVELNPDAAAIGWGEKFKRYRAANKDASLKISDSTLEASTLAFSKSMLSKGLVPEDISINVVKRPKVPLYGGGLFKKASTSEDLDIETPSHITISDLDKKHIFNIYNTYKANPEKLEDMAKLLKVDVSHITPEMATAITINQGRIGAVSKSGGEEFSMAARQSRETNPFQVAKKGLYDEMDRLTQEALNAQDLETRTTALEERDRLKEIAYNGSIVDIMNAIPPKKMQVEGAPEQVTTTSKEDVTMGETQAKKSSEFHSFISEKEAGPAGYDSINYKAKKYFSTGFKPTEHTVGEVLAEQKAAVAGQRKAGIPTGDRSSAVGQYQIIYSTLKQAAEKLGIGMDEPFTSELQDKIVSEYLLKDKRPQIGKFLESDSPTPQQEKSAVKALQNEWEAFSKVGYDKTLEILNSMRK